MIDQLFAFLLVAALFTSALCVVDHAGRWLVVRRERRLTGVVRPLRRATAAAPALRLVHRADCSDPAARRAPVVASMRYQTSERAAG